MEKFFKCNTPNKTFYEVRFGKKVTDNIFSYSIERDHFENFLEYVKNKAEYRDVKNSEYALYTHEDMVYNIFRDGSSFGYKKNMVNRQDFDTMRWSIYDFKNYQNDEFPSLMEYVKIEECEAIIFVYNGLNLEFLERSNITNKDMNHRHYEVRIIMQPDRYDFKLAKELVKVFGELDKS